MDTIGIIAEYNPFHNGHQYQIEQIKKQTGAKNIVIAMSGDFVQRGAPAWTDKYLRTEMALSGGADFVFELPVSVSTASAEHFAYYGVSLLTSLGFVDGICFGSECGNLPLLQKIARFLSFPPGPFEHRIASLTAKGISYPAARQQTLADFFPAECRKNPSLLSSPNNILAIEYLKAITVQNSPLIPFCIPRKEKGYHDCSLEGRFCSASAIRYVGRKISEKQVLPYKQSQMCNSLPAKIPAEYSCFLQDIQAFVPQSTIQLLEKSPNRYPVTENDFSDLLYYRLSHLTEDDRDILDMAPEIFCRIQNKLSSFVNYSDFILQVKTKQYTHSRISRVLLHCLLHIYQDTFFYTLPYLPYARMLGFSGSKSALLRTKPKIPVIVKPADGIRKIKAFYQNMPPIGKKPVCPAQNSTANANSCSSAQNAFIKPACQMYANDIAASNLYRQVQQISLGCSRPNEYQSWPVKIY